MKDVREKPRRKFGCANNRTPHGRLQRVVRGCEPTSAFSRRECKPIGERYSAGGRRIDSDPTTPARQRRNRHGGLFLEQHRRRSPRGASRHRLFCDRGHRRRNERSQIVTPAPVAAKPRTGAQTGQFSLPSLPSLPSLQIAPWERRVKPVERRRNTPAAGQHQNRRRLSLWLSPAVCGGVHPRRCLSYRTHVAATDESLSTHPAKPLFQTGETGEERKRSNYPVRENRNTAAVLDWGDGGDGVFSQRCVVYGTPTQRARGRALYSVSGGFAGAATRRETCNETDTPRPPRRYRRSRATPRRGPGRASRRGPAQLCVLCRAPAAAPTAAHGGEQ